VYEKLMTKIVAIPIGEYKRVVAKSSPKRCNVKNSPTKIIA
jgi:hypothetical protein